MSTLYEAGIEKIFCIPQNYYHCRRRLRHGEQHLATSEERRDQARQFMHRHCQELGITLHIPEGTLKMPLSPGFVQFSDGMVVMTSENLRSKPFYRVS